MSKNLAKIEFVLAMIIYGTIGLVLRWTDLPSEILVLARGTIGSVFILCYVLIRGKKPSASAIKSNFGWLVLGGVSLGLNWISLFAAYRFTTVAIASLCNYMAPMIVIFLSPLLFREKLTWKKLLCVAAAALGICLVSGAFSGDLVAANLKGVLFGMGAAICFVGILISNKMTHDISQFDKVIVQLAISAVVILPYVLVMNYGKHIDFGTMDIVWMVTLAIVHTGIAYCFYFGSMAVLPMQTVALWGYLEPVVSVLCSALILAEPLGITGVIGSVLVLSAAIISERVN